MENGKSRLMVTRDELEQYVNEQTANIIDVMNVVNALKKAVNNQAEALALDRFVMEKFVPGPLLEQAVKEFKAVREAQIAAETASAEKAN